MDKRSLSERDFCTNFPTPVLRQADCDDVSDARRKAGSTKGCDPL